MSGASSLAPVGSSPLTRGKPDREMDALDAARLIPAHAGKTVAFEVSGEGARAHPRSRGENTGVVMVASALDGSSPLTRGKLGRNRDGRVISRLIPAHAGKTTNTRRPHSP